MAAIELDQQGSVPPTAGVETREPWGVLALLQFVSFTVLAVLVWEALKEIHLGLPAASGSHAFLIDAGRFIETSLVERLDRAFAPEFRITALKLSDSVSVWALVSTGGNFVSALLLFYIAATSFRKGSVWPRAIVLAFAVIAIVLSAAATPFLFATMKNQTGQDVWFDVSSISFLLFVAYLVVDVLSHYGQNSKTDSSLNFAVLILAVDLPCLMTTIIFLFCNQYGHLPPPFTVGVSAGLLTIYSLAFFLLCAGFWAKTNRGEVTMKTLTGPVAVAIAIGAALNAAIGFLVQFAKLPIYLDVVGSVLVALLYGPVAGVFSAILGILAVGVITTPITIAYVGTAVGVTIAAWYLKRFGYGERLVPTVVLGTFILGPISSILSIPITTYLFSGVTFTGSDYITAFFRSSGMALLSSIATGAFVFDALDKGAVSLLVYLIYLRAPAWAKIR
ncbi:MAG: energy-coupling factor transport system substrate-specific component [Methylobacteriaceae bacterium]|nr:energy-coupling factor transport system substrate-specific component [Methylobacteriaceae bacterium]